MEALFYTSHKSFLQKPQRGHSFCKGIIRDVKYLSNHLKSVRRDIPANYQGGNHPSQTFTGLAFLKIATLAKQFYYQMAKW